MNATMILNRAEELREELIENRRTLHSYAETGFDLPQTTAFVEKKLREYGLTPVRCGKAGITCVIGDPKKGKCFLLRGDMDPAHDRGIGTALCGAEWSLPLLRT